MPAKTATKSLGRGGGLGKTKKTKNAEIKEKPKVEIPKEAIFLGKVEKKVKNPASTKKRTPRKPRDPNQPPKPVPPAILGTQELIMAKHYNLSGSIDRILKDFRTNHPASFAAVLKKAFHKATPKLTISDRAKNAILRLSLRFIQGMAHESVKYTSENTEKETIDLPLIKAVLSPNLSSLSSVAGATVAADTAVKNYTQSFMDEADD